MQKWDAFVEHLKQAMSSDAIGHWLSNLKIVKFDALNLHLEVHDRFQFNWFSEHILPIAAKEFKHGERPIRIHLNTGEQKPIESQHQETQRAKSSQFEPVVLSNQQFAKKLLESISTCDENQTGIALSTYNPIVLYGPSGCGKSHLLNWCATRLASSGKNVIHLDGEAFTEDVVKAIRRGEMEAFRKRYRAADVFIIDDMNRLANRSATQEEFFHTFNTLHIANKQIVASAPHHPQRLKGLEQRLISRFEWGIAVEIEAIDSSDVLTICKNRKVQLGLDLSEESLHDLIDQLDGDLKKLIKALEILAYKLDLNDHPSNLKGDHTGIAKFHLRQFIQQHQNDRATPQVIIDQVAAHFGIRSLDILGRSQNREFTRPRRLAMYLCRSALQLPFVKIGEIFQRDHSTVMSNCKHIEKTLSCQQTVPDLMEVSRRLDFLKA